MLKKRDRLGVFLITMLVVSIVVNLLQTKALLKDRKAQTAKAMWQQTSNLETNNVPEKLVSLKEFEQQLYLTFDEDEIKTMAERVWSCIISVNGQELKGNTKYINSEAMTILVAEVIDEETVLPNTITVLGALEQEAEEKSLLDYFRVYSEVPYEVECVKEEQGTKYYLKFEQIPDGTVITLQLSEKFKSRMHYNEKIAEDRITIIRRMN